MEAMELSFGLSAITKRITRVLVKTAGVGFSVALKNIQFKV